MSREDFIKDKIKQKGLTVKAFAEEIDMPYSTLLSMLNGSIGGAAVDKVINICKGLGITVYELEAARDDYFNNGSVAYSPKEQLIIKKYRRLDDSGKENIDVNLDLQYKRCVGVDNTDAEFSESIC